MKKIFRFTISILLALCITATGISPFVVIARQNTQQADLLLDDVLASPLVNLIIKTVLIVVLNKPFHIHLNMKL